MGSAGSCGIEVPPLPSNILASQARASQAAACSCVHEESGSRDLALAHREATDAAERSGTSSWGRGSLYTAGGALSSSTKICSYQRMLKAVSPREETPQPPPAEAVENQSAELEFDIPEDAYGAAVLAIVRDFQEAYSGHDRMLNFVTGSFALLLGVLNVVLQFLLLGYLQTYVVHPKVHMVQELYKHYHEEVFDDSGEFIVDRWNDYDRQHELCQIAMTNGGFYAASLFLWWAEMMKEFRTTWRLFLNINAVPSCSRGSQMLRIEETENIMESPKVNIVALTGFARFFLYVVVCLPKLLISMLLLWSGSEWLSATNLFEDLIMNAVAMTFVTHIDELLYEIFLPGRYREEVAAINFVMKIGKEPPQEVRGRELWAGFRRSFFYALAILAGIACYAQYLQDVLPHNVSHLRKHCRAYMEMVQPLCSETIIDRVKAIVKGGYASSHCYPYGS